MTNPISSERTQSVDLVAMLLKLSEDQRVSSVKKKSGNMMWIKMNGGFANLQDFEAFLREKSLPVERTGVDR